MLPLPPGEGPYQTDMIELEARFVTGLGSPSWRVELFDSFSAVRGTVGAALPSARWLLWGCFVSAHREALDGDSQVLSALAILPGVDVESLGGQLPMLIIFLQTAEAQHKVDAGFVFEFAAGDDRNLDTMEALEAKWLPRARRGVADHASRVLVPAGYVEVAP